MTCADTITTMFKRYGHLIVMVLALAMVIIAAGCASTISRETLLEQMSTTAAPVIVDVRSQGEYDRDHIPGALHIHFYSIGSGLAEQGLLKQEPIVLYCEHGPRASIAGITLFLSGYAKVFSLEGHMKGWRKNGFPIEIIKP